MSTTAEGASVVFLLRMLDTLKKLAELISEAMYREIVSKIVHTVFLWASVVLSVVQQIIEESQMGYLEFTKPWLVTSAAEMARLLDHPLEETSIPPATT